MPSRKFLPGVCAVVQSTAQIACRNMGFGTGVLQDTAMSATLLPPWLSGIRCAGPEADITACPRSSFGDTASCRDVQRLFCITNGMLPSITSCPAFVVGQGGRPSYCQ